MCSLCTVSYTHLDVYKRQTQGVVCPVEVFSLTELTSDDNPILVHVATQHAYARSDQKKVIDWDRYGPALPVGPLDSCLLYTSRCV